MFIFVVLHQEKNAFPLQKRKSRLDIYIVIPAGHLHQGRDRRDPVPDQDHGLVHPYAADATAAQVPVPRVKCD